MWSKAPRPKQKVLKLATVLLMLTIVIRGSKLGIGKFLLEQLPKDVILQLQ